MKVIILRKIHVKLKSFALPFSTIERNETYALAADVLHTVLE